MSELKFISKTSPAFELVVAVRDSVGEPTGKLKSYTTDSPMKLWQFYMRYQGKPKRKRKDKGVEGDKKSIDKLVKEMAEYSEKRIAGREENI